MDTYMKHLVPSLGAINEITTKMKDRMDTYMKHLVPSLGAINEITTKIRVSNGG